MRRSGKFKGRSTRTSRFRSGRRGTVVTAYNANNSAYNFRSKRLSAKRWRNMIWNNTLQKQHFRSVFAFAGTGTAPTGVTAMTTATFGSNLMLNLAGGALPFWTAGGGAITADAAVPVPVFSQSSVVLRGGMSVISFANRSVADTVRMRVWAVYIKERPEAATLPPNGTFVPREWDPSVQADFAQSYRILYSREVLLLPGSRPMELKHRHRVKKIDDNDFLIEGGDQLMWMYTIAKSSDVDAIAEVVDIVVSYNLSFSGDAAT